MTQKIIGLGDPDKGNGDPLRTAFGKVNDNFTELYTLVGVASLTELAQDYAAKMFTDGTHVGVTVEYDDLGNVINLTSLGQTSSGETAPVSPTAGTLWWDSVSGRLYVYYGTSWVDASPVDGAGISSTNQLVNGAHTVSLSSVGLTAFPAISNESLFIQASELGSANASIGISAKNSVIVTADILDTAKQWTFGTEGKLTLPAGTTFEYLSAPLTGHGDGLARLDFSLVTDGVSTQWAAASANPAGSGYSPGNTFTFDEVFLGIPGASVTIQVLTVGLGGSVENLAFSQPPLYPADIYRDSPVNLQVGTTSSNRWTFGGTGDLTVPGGLIFPNTTVQTTAYIPPTTGNSIISSQDPITISRNGMTIRITAAGVAQMSFDSVIDIKGRSSINNAGSTTIATPNGDTVIGTWYDISTALALGDQLVSTIMDSSFHNVYRITVLIREQDTTPGVEFTTAYAIIEQIQ